MLCLHSNNVLKCLFLTGLCANTFYRFMSTYDVRHMQIRSFQKVRMVTLRNGFQVFIVLLIELVFKGKSNSFVLSWKIQAFPTYINMYCYSS